MECLCGNQYNTVLALVEHIDAPIRADAKPDYAIELPGEAKVNEEIEAMGQESFSAEEMFGRQETETRVPWTESDSSRRALLDQSPLPTFEDEQAPALPDDPWIHRSEGMRCRTCISFVPKVCHGSFTTDPRGALGRCRKHAPTMGGFPAVFETDWCGDHKIDEEKL